MIDCAARKRAKASVLQERVIILKIVFLARLSSTPVYLVLFRSSFFPRRGSRCLESPRFEERQLIQQTLTNENTAVGETCINGKTHGIHRELSVQQQYHRVYSSAQKYHQA